MNRCQWAETTIEMQQYHDEEWGKAHHDDRYLFELLILEGLQAGLSWQIIINRRDGIREALYNFDWQQLKLLTEAQKLMLMNHPTMIKHRLKIDAIQTNAIAFEKIRNEFGSFDTYIWSFTNGKSISSSMTSDTERIAENELSNRISKDLKKRGFKFVGNKIIYAYLEAIGILENHLNHCCFKPN